MCDLCVKYVTYVTHVTCVTCVACVTCVRRSEAILYPQSTVRTTMQRMRDSSVRLLRCEFEYYLLRSCGMFPRKLRSDCQAQLPRPPSALAHPSISGPRKLVLPASVKAPVGHSAQAPPLLIESDACVATRASLRLQTLQTLLIESDACVTTRVLVTKQRL